MRRTEFIKIGMGIGIGIGTGIEIGIGLENQLQGGILHAAGK